MSKLSRNGYTIRKKNFTSNQIKEFKDELTMCPYSVNDFGEKNRKNFTLYLESPKKLYMPRFYGLTKLGEPERNILNDGEELNINFNGSLRKEQEPVFDVSYKTNNGYWWWNYIIKMWWWQKLFLLYIFCHKLNEKQLL